MPYGRFGFAFQDRYVGVLANKFDTMYFDNDKAKYKWL